MNCKKKGEEDRGWMNATRPKFTEQPKKIKRDREEDQMLPGLVHLREICLKSAK
jgi:hypothetical protein